MENSRFSGMNAGSQGTVKGPGQSQQQQKPNNPQASVNRMVEEASGAASQAMNSAKERISDNPSTAVFSAFGIGLGVGLGLAMLLVPQPTRHIDTALKDKLSNLMSEHFGWMSR